jgi:hypothetical protein
MFSEDILTVEAFKYHPDSAKVQAAENIRMVINHYGDLRSKSYNEETASIHNLLENVNSRYAADVALLGIEEWIDELSVANRAFHDLMSQRFDTVAQEITNLREVRKEVNRVYGAIVDRINASAVRRRTLRRVRKETERAHRVFQNHSGDKKRPRTESDGKKRKRSLKLLTTQKSSWNTFDCALPTTRLPIVALLIQKCTL